MTVEKAKMRFASRRYFGDDDDDDDDIGNPIPFSRGRYHETATKKQMFSRRFIIFAATFLTGLLMLLFDEFLTQYNSNDNGVVDVSSKSKTSTKPFILLSRPICRPNLPSFTTSEPNQQLCKSNDAMTIVTNAVATKVGYAATASEHFYRNGWVWVDVVLQVAEASRDDMFMVEFVGWYGQNGYRTVLNCVGSSETYAVSIPVPMLLNQHQMSLVHHSKCSAKPSMAPISFKVEPKEQQETNLQLEVDLEKCPSTQEGIAMMSHGAWIDENIHYPERTSESSQWTPFCCQAPSFPGGPKTTTHLIGDATLKGRTVQVANVYDGTDVMWYDFLLRMEEVPEPDSVLVLNQGAAFLQAGYQPEAAGALALRMLCHAALFFPGKILLLHTTPSLYSRTTTPVVHPIDMMQLNAYVQTELQTAQFQLLELCQQKSLNLLSLWVRPSPEGQITELTGANMTKTEAKVAELLPESLNKLSTRLSSRRVFHADTNTWLASMPNNIPLDASYWKHVNTLSAIREDGDP